MMTKLVPIVGLFDLSWAKKLNAITINNGGRDSISSNQNGGGGGDGRGKHARRSAILLPLIQFLVTADGISDACWRHRSGPPF